MPKINITKVSYAGLQLIKKFEGFKSHPYLCPAKVATIGYGATYYPDGKRVTLKDAPITEIVASDLLANMLGIYEKAVDSFTTDAITQTQFDALVSFAYNVGVTALKNSTLLKKVNINPNDPAIATEFRKWVKGGGKTLPGLVTRRALEIAHYFKK